MKSTGYVKAMFMEGVELPDGENLRKQGINETEEAMLRSHCDDSLKFTHGVALVSHATLENPDQDSTIEAVEGAHVCNN